MDDQRNLTLKDQSKEQTTKVTVGSDGSWKAETPSGAIVVALLKAWDSKTTRLLMVLIAAASGLVVNELLEIVPLLQ